MTSAEDGNWHQISQCRHAFAACASCCRFVIGRDLRDGLIIPPEMEIDPRLPGGPGARSPAGKQG
jgi:hypothetical protein